MLDQELQLSLIYIAEVATPSLNVQADSIRAKVFV